MSDWKLTELPEWDEEVWQLSLEGTGRACVVTNIGSHIFAFVPNGSCMGGPSKSVASIQEGKEFVEQFLADNPDWVESMKARSARIDQNRANGTIDWEDIKPDG